MGVDAVILITPTTEQQFHPTPLTLGRHITISKQRARGAHLLANLTQPNILAREVDLVLMSTSSLRVRRFTLTVYRDKN